MRLRSHTSEAGSPTIEQVRSFYFQLHRFFLIKWPKPNPERKNPRGLVITLYLVIGGLTDCQQISQNLIKNCICMH